MQTKSSMKKAQPEDFGASVKHRWSLSLLLSVHLCQRKNWNLERQIAPAGRSNCPMGLVNAA
jgi:hypothetical protein